MVGRFVATGIVASCMIGAQAAALVHYEVPPMSDVKRLPDTPVADGVKGGTVRIILAKDEYEPGSFVIEPLEDLGRVQLALTPFTNERGETLPADSLDLKVVKVWYQNRNAWNNYFGDTGFALCPELLLNDENLIRVDTAKTANYARLTAKDGSVTEQWINPPRQMDKVFWDWHNGGEAFTCMRPEFADADTLQPVELRKGERKQFFLTVRTGKETKAGVYRGAVEVKVKDEGEQRRKNSLHSIHVAVRVLDFVLPAPASYADETRLFDISFYTHDSIAEFTRLNGGDFELAKRQFAAVMKNRVAHGQTVNFCGHLLSPVEGDCTRAAMREAGMREDIAVGVVPYADSGFDVELEATARRSYAAVTNALGHGNVCAVYGDETGATTLRDNHRFYRAMRKAGYRLFLANTEKLFRLSACDYAGGWVNFSDAPDNDAMPLLWGRLPNDTTVAWYANQHVASENPAFNRRQNGLAAYLAGYTALCNYAHYNQPYNDDSTTYRPMCMTYVHAKGCIDTLQWEGFREGVDDIRYATKLVTLARKAAKSSDTTVREAGILALQQLALFDRKTGDPAACRREMTRHILKLIDLEK